MPHHRTNSMHLFMLSREPLLTAIIWLPRETSQIQGIRRRRLRRRKGRHRRVSGPGRCFGQTVAEVGGCRLSTQWPRGSIAVFRHRAAQQRRTLRSTLVAPESPPKSWEQRTLDRECRKAAPHYRVEKRIRDAECAESRPKKFHLNRDNFFSQFRRGPPDHSRVPPRLKGRLRTPRPTQVLSTRQRNLPALSWRNLHAQSWRNLGAISRGC